jgi:hypothetical protein
MSDGWRCPGCGRCFAPSVTECLYCKPVCGCYEDYLCRKALEWLVDVLRYSPGWQQQVRAACRMAGIPWPGERESDEAR